MEQLSLGVLHRISYEIIIKMLARTTNTCRLD